MGVINTKIKYLYRDASNYKMPNIVIVKGCISQEQIDAIIGSLNEGEFFIPSQVGLPEERFDGWSEDDHVWFELEERSFDTTSDNPTVDMTVQELADAFVSMSGKWNEQERLEELAEYE